MGGILLNIRSWWETADRTQRVVTIFGSAFLILLLGGTFYFSSKPKMALAYGGLTPGDQGRVVSEIQKLGIPVEYDLVGNVMVPSDKVAEAQAMLAKNGVAPTSGHLGNSDRGSIGIMSPKSVEDAQLNAIREGEIAQTLESLTGVSSAKVLLSTGEKSAFAKEDDPPTASVTITEDPGTDLSGAPAKAMASLVAKAVPGLTTKNVSIVNQDGVSLFDGSELEGTSASFASKVSAQVAEAKRVKRELQPLLDRFGVGATVLTVRVEMDFDKKVEHKEDISAKKSDPLFLEQASETMTGNQSAAVGTSGVTGGIGAPGSNDPSGKSSGDYNSKQARKEFPYSKVTTDTEKAPGTVTRLFVSVLADSGKIKDTTAIKGALEGYLGVTPATKDLFSVTVTPATFDYSQAEDLKKAAGSAAGRQTTQQIMSLLPIGALILVAMMIIKSVAKVAKSQTVAIAALPGGGMMNAGPGALEASIGEEAMGALPSSATGEVDYSALEQAPRPKRKKKKLNPNDEDEWEEDEPMHIRIGRINEKVNVPLEQLKKMSKEKPEAVAMLLKSWLVEERR